MAKISCAKAVKNYLANLNIAFKTHTHPAVYTCEQAAKYDKEIKGIHCKNLFLKDRKSRRFYLVILPADQELNIRDLGEQIGDKLKFANENDLGDILNLTSGSVSPFGLINDKESRTEVVISKRVWDADFVSFHPNINTETLELKGDDFHRYLKSLKNDVRII